MNKEDEEFSKIKPMTLKEHKKKNKDTPRKIVAETEGEITQASVLIKKQYSTVLTANQKKIFSILMTKLLDQTETEFQSKEFNEVKISRQDLDAILGNKFFNQDLIEDLKILAKMDVKINTEDLEGLSVISSFTPPRRGNSILSDGKNFIIRFDTGFTTLLYHYYKIGTEKYDNILPFIKMPINELEALKSIHSLTLYEIAKKSLNKHARTRLNMTDDEIRIFFNIENYSTSAIYQRIIKKSVKEIMSKTKIIITYKRVKLSKGKYQYKFEFINSFKDLTQSDFIKQFKKLSYYKSLTFNFYGTNYSFERVDNQDYKKVIDQTIVIHNDDIITKKINQEYINSFNYNDRLNKHDSLPIYEKLYQIFLEIGALCFAYQIFILKNIDDNYIKDANEILKEDLEFCIEQSNKFIYSLDVDKDLKTK